MKRSRLLPLLLLTALAAAVYLQVRRLRPGEVGPVEGDDDAAVRAFERRLEAEDAPDRGRLSVGKSTISVDEDGGEVIRRDAAGRVEWSARLGDGLRSWWWPAMLTDGRRVYVKEQFRGVTALDAATGAVAWQAQVQVECFRLSGDLLVLANGPQVVGLSTSGEVVFRLPLPADPGFRPVAVEEAAGLFLVQSHESPFGYGDAFLFDRAGKVRHRLPRQVVAAASVGPDRIFLTSADVRRVTPDDRAVWSVPFESPEWIAGGGMLEAPGGDLVAFVYGRISNTGVQVMRLDPATGEVRWQARCGGLSGVTHSIYRHDATAEWVRDRLRVISRGSAGTFVERLDGRTGEQVYRGERREF